MNIAGTPENLRPFTSDNQPANRGRKPSLLKKYAEESDLSASDIRKVLKTLVFEKTEDELKELRKDGSQAMFVRMLIAGLEQDFQRGRTAYLNWILDRVFGDMKTSTKLDENVFDPNEVRMSKEDLAAFQRNLSILLPDAARYIADERTTVE